jgi:phospholipase/lecithinase/hemolysin
LLDDIVANASTYGLTNKLSGGYSIDAIADTTLTDKSLNGPGATYIFWDYLDPTAKVQEILADTVQHLITPPRFGHITSAGPNVNLQLTGMPIGLGGYLDGSTDLQNWSLVAAFIQCNADVDHAGSAPNAKLSAPISVRVDLAVMGQGKTALRTNRLLMPSRR